MKTCSQCGESKELTEFERTGSYRRSYCKVCRKLRAKSYNHKEKIPEDFWSRVDVGDSSRCWEWQGSVSNTGYGSFWWCGATAVTSRIAAELAGLIASAHTGASRKACKTRSDYVLHKCDNRRCCNPSHLFLGTFSDNMFDAYKKGRKIQPKGQHHTNAKTTDIVANKIRRLYATGRYSQQAVADSFGVSRCVVGAITRGETYKC